MMEDRSGGSRRDNNSSAQSWVRALTLTAGITRQPSRLLFNVIEELAGETPEAPALLSDRESLTYRGLVQRANRYARWALALGLGKDDCVALFMPNRPDFIAAWLGITQAGSVVALLNTNLIGPSLAHCINRVAPRHLIVADELRESLTAALPSLTRQPSVWVSGGGDPPSHQLETELEQHESKMLCAEERRPLTIQDSALYIYTSGTTGLPKAARVSHGRLMQWSYWFAGLMDTSPSDRMFDCLPLYHSVGGVQAPGSVLVRGGSVVVSERFSARRFWSDIARWECTLFQYIGELCRYLVGTEVSPDEAVHRVRLACGNGLRPDVWHEFKNRFRIPRILEFYASTEGNVSLFNIEEEPGAIGRIPSYLAHRFPVALVKTDSTTGEPKRDERGFCIRCGPHEVGEVLGPLSQGRDDPGGQFEGYTDCDETEKKILRNGFSPGDAFFRTGDLMRKDERGFFHFVDRVGDTFRWKGENVSTAEVAEAICAHPGVKEAIVYGVEVAGADGKAGMATVVADENLNLRSLRDHLTRSLPQYACPMFLRLRKEIAVTGTFKYVKEDLVREAYDPTTTSDPILFDDCDAGAFVLLDKALHDCLRSGPSGIVRDRRKRLREAHSFGSVNEGR